MICILILLIFSTPYPALGYDYQAQKVRNQQALYWNLYGEQQRRNEELQDDIRGLEKQQERILDKLQEEYHDKFDIYYNDY